MLPTFDKRGKVRNKEVSAEVDKLNLRPFRTTELKFKAYSWSIYILFYNVGIFPEAASQATVY